MPWIRELLDLLREEDPERGAVAAPAMVGAGALDGEGEVDPQGGAPELIHATFTLPQGGAIGVPAGTTLLDYGNGELHHSNYSAALDDSAQGIEDVSGANAARSLSLWCDVAAEVSVGESDRWEIPAGRTVTVESTKFSAVRLHTDAPARIASVASTRRMPYASDVSANLRRVANLGDAVRDSYSNIKWTTPTIKDREGNYSTYAEPAVPIQGRTATVMVRNTSSSANKIDVEVQGHADRSEGWLQLAQAVGIDQGDHHIFTVEQPHAELRVRFRASTAGTSVAAHGQMFGGDTL